MDKKIPKSWKPINAGPDVGGGLQPSPSEIQDENMVEPVQTLVDTITTLPQGMLLENADEAIAAFSPEMADRYRDIVKKARERSPMATTIGELFTPDVLSLVTGIGSKIPKIAKAASKVGKGWKALGGDVATSVAMQQGESGEIDPLSTTAAAGLGQVVRNVPKLFGSKVPQERLTQTGLRDRAKEFGVRSGKGMTAEEGMLEVVKRLEDSGIQSGGISSFDPKTLTWVSKSPVKSKMLPVSEREFIQRIETGKEGVSKEIDKILNESSFPVFEDSALSSINKRIQLLEKANKATPSKYKGSLSLTDSLQNRKSELAQLKAKKAELESSSLRTETTGIFNLEDVVDQAKDTMYGDLPTLTPEEVNSAEKMFSRMVRNIFPEKASNANVNDLMEAKRKLYKRINYNKEEDAIQDSLRKSLASTLNDMINKAASDSPRLLKLNQMYGDLAETGIALNKKAQKKLKQPEFIDPSVGALSPVYGALRFLKDSRENIGRPVSQISKTLEESPRLEQTVNRPIRKGFADMFSSEGESQSPIYRGPQSVMSPQERLEMNIPKQLMDTKLPRTSEGVVENAKIFKLKIAQEAEDIVRARAEAAGVDSSMLPPEQVRASAKQLYLNVSTVLDEKPDEVGKLLPAWTVQFPHMFEEDPYNRVDGVVPVSLQPKLREDIRKNDEMSNTDKIKALNNLNKTGKYQD